MSDLDTQFPGTTLNIICTYKRDNTYVRPVRKFVRSSFFVLRSSFVTLHFKIM